MFLEEIEDYIDTNKEMKIYGKEERFNVLINHYDLSLYEKVKSELSCHKLIEIDACQLLYDQIPFFGNICEIKLSSRNKFLSEIDNNSILLIKNIDKIEKSQYRSSLLSALSADCYCLETVAEKIRKTLTCIAFINTNDKNLLYLIRVLDGKDQFAYYDGEEMKELCK